MVPPAPTMKAPPPSKVEVSKKNVPQPSNPLKSFNWSKLPDSKLQGTVWSELDESKMYNTIDLESIDKLFSAYQKNGVAVSYFPSLLMRSKISFNFCRMMDRLRTLVNSVNKNLKLFPWSMDAEHRIVQFCWVNSKWPMKRFQGMSDFRHSIQFQKILL